MVATQHGTEHLVQATMGAEKPQPHGDARNSQPLRNFLRGILQYIAQETNLPEVSRESSDGPRKESTHLAARVVLLGSCPTGGKMFGKVFARFGIAVLERDMPGVVPLAKQVDRSVGGDARDPSVQVVLKFMLLAGELIDARKGFYQGFLLGVFSVSRISRETQCTAI
jgi:hypothetical protein